jgi:uncharacterized lipoprotein YmbA
MKRTGRTSSFIIICCASGILTACGVSAPARYYGLLPIATTAEHPIGADTVVVVGPVRIAEYLNRPQIVTRGNGVEMKFSEYDRWTEPLDATIKRTISGNLEILLESKQVFEFPPYGKPTHSHQVVMEVSRFDADAGGTAILEVQWGIADETGAIEDPPRRARYTAPVADPGDFATIVAGLNETIGAFSLDIAERIQQLQ